MFKIMKKKMSWIFLLSWLVSSVKGESTTVVETDKGSVIGEILQTVLNSMVYASFRGIPYAEPPVGERRFKPPVEKAAWTDTLNATSEGSMCTQYDSTSGTAVGSEDCLYLNVFTPHTDFNDTTISKPVMVWIYGGSFTTGNSNASYYGPDFILEEDVIVVSFNYRLSALGFLNLNHDNATGNCGLKDQNLVLKWVQNNIAAFGGNPNNVTIFGQSAGSVSVDLQVLSDMSVGLFQRAISMSGSTLCLYWGFQSSTEAVQNAFSLGSALGTTTLVKDTLLQALYNATAAEIVIAANDIGFIPFRPTIESTDVAISEEKFLTQCSVNKYTSGNYTKGPHIMGFTANETLSFAGSSTDDLVGLTDEAFDSMNNSSALPSLPILSSIVSAIAAGTTNLNEAAVYNLIKQTTDLFFVTGIDAKQQLMQVNNDDPIYYYRFSVTSNYSAHEAVGVELQGTGHGDDLPYIFYMPIFGLPLDQSDIALTRQRLVRLWTNFAKYGNPTPDGESDDVLGITWTESGSAGAHLEIGENLSMGSRPTDTSVRLLQLAGLGASSVLNQCSSTNILVSSAEDELSDAVDNIVGVIGGLFGKK